MAAPEGGPTTASAKVERARGVVSRSETGLLRPAPCGSTELAAEFGVTSMTIHRDLNVLEAQGWVRKVRGGATVDTSALIDTTVRHRLADMVGEKQEIARAALWNTPTVRTR